MPKNLVRFVALVLLPGLLLDPVTAHAALDVLHAPPTIVSLRKNPTETEALMSRPLFSGTYWALRLKSNYVHLKSHYESWAGRLKESNIPRMSPEVRWGLTIGAVVVLLILGGKFLWTAPVIFGICDRAYIDWRLKDQEANSRDYEEEEKSRKDREAKEEQQREEERKKRVEEFDKSLKGFVENMERVVEDDGKLNRLLDDLTKHDISKYVVRSLGRLTDERRLSLDAFPKEIAGDLIKNGVFAESDRSGLEAVLGSQEMKQTVETLVAKTQESFLPVKTDTLQKVFEEPEHTHEGLTHQQMHQQGIQHQHAHTHEKHHDHPKGPNTTKLRSILIPLLPFLGLLGYLSYHGLTAHGLPLAHLLRSPWFYFTGSTLAVGLALNTSSPSNGKGNGQELVQETEQDPIKRYTINLNEMAKAGKMDESPFIEKIQDLDKLLASGSKRNVVVVGDPGTTRGFIQAVAQDVASKDPTAVPPNLRNREFLYLNVASLLYLMAEIGRFESTIQELSDALEKAVKQQGKQYVFVFDFQQLYWIKRERSNLLSNISFLFKNILDNKDIQVIGLCNEKHYDEFFSSSGGEDLKRSFERMPLKDLPGYKASDYVRTFLRRASTIYSKLKALGIQRIFAKNETLEKALIYVRRHMPYGQIPGKLEEMIDQLLTEQVERSATNQIKLHTLRRKILRAIVRLEEATHKGDLEETRYLKKALNQYGLEVNALQTAAASSNKKESNTLELTLPAIVQLISRETGVPPEKIIQESDDKLTHYISNIRKKLIGQKQAVTLTYKAFKRRHDEMSEPNKPTGGFIFVGPTGVGKTELAKAIDEQYFGGDGGLVRFDMSEYMDGNAEEKLIGAPPGYVGYEEGGQLTNAVRKRPFSVVLLDEIEKANPKVYDLLLQLMDKGELTDSHGRKVDFRNTILIMTSNLGMTPEVYDMYTAAETLGSLSEDTFEQVRDILPFYKDEKRLENQDVFSQFVIDSYARSPGYNAAKHRQLRDEAQDGTLEKRRVALRQQLDVFKSQKPMQQVLETLATVGFETGTPEDAHELIFNFTRSQIRKSVERFFSRRPELLPRLEAIGDVIVFDQLTRDDLQDILDIKLFQKNDALAQQGLQLVLAPALRDEIIRQGYDPEKGARPMERALNRIVIAPLSQEILKDVYRPGDLITGDFKDGHAIFEVTRQAKEEENLETPLIQSIEEALRGNAKLELPLVDKLFGLSPTLPLRPTLSAEELPVDLDAEAMIEAAIIAQGGLSQAEEKKLRDAIQKEIQEQKELLNKYFTNLSLFAVEGKIATGVTRGEDVAAVIRVLEQRKRNAPFLVNHDIATLNDFVAEVSRESIQGEVPEYERVRFLKLNLERFSSQFTLIGKIEDQMRRFLDAIEADDARKGIRTIIVMDYDELEREIPIYRGVDTRMTPEPFNLGFFMIPFMGRKDVRVMMTTKKQDIQNNEAFDHFFTKVAIGNLEQEEAIERFHLFDAVKSVSVTGRHTLEYPFSVLKAAAALFKKELPKEPLLGVLQKLFDYVSSKKLKSREALLTTGIRAKQRIAQILQEFIDEGTGHVTPDQLLHKEELVSLVREVRSLEQQLSEASRPVEPLALEDVHDFLADRYEKDKKSLSVDEKKNLLSLEIALDTKIIDQKPATSALAHAVRIGKAGLKALHKPIGAFLFPGPTGVGKTETVYRLGALLGMDVIRMDMSEFKKPQDAAKLIGAPPGYVGYEDSNNWLTTKVIRKPRSIILFDEIDKLFEQQVSPEGVYGKSVLDIVLQMLEDGRLTDAKGNTADFSECIIVFTSNGGINVRFEKTPEGLVPVIDNGIYGEIKEAVEHDNEDKFQALRAKIMERVNTYHRHMLRPEFLNRLDDTIIFDPLRKGSLENIVDLFLAEFADQMANRYQLVFGRDAEERLAIIRYLMSFGFAPDKGARGIKNVLNKDLKDRLGEFLDTQGTYKKEDKVFVLLNPQKDGFAFHMEKFPEISLREKMSLNAAEEAIFNNMAAGLNTLQGQFPTLEAKDIDPWLEPVPLASKDKGKEIKLSGPEIRTSKENDYTRVDAELNPFIKAKLQHVQAKTSSPELSKTVGAWLKEAVTLAKRENIQQTAWREGGRLEQFYDLETGALTAIKDRYLENTNRSGKTVQLDYEAGEHELTFAVRFNSSLPQGLYRRLFEDTYSTPEDVEQKANRLLQGLLKAQVQLREFKVEIGFSCPSPSETTLWIKVPPTSNIRMLREFLQTLPQGSLSSEQQKALQQRYKELSLPPVQPATGDDYADQALRQVLNGLTELNPNLYIIDRSFNAFDNWLKKNGTPKDSLASQNLQILLKWIVDYGGASEEVRSKAKALLENMPAAPSTGAAHTVTSLLGLAKDADPQLPPLPKIPIEPSILETIHKSLQLHAPDLAAAIPFITEAYYASRMPSYAAIDINKDHPVWLLDEHLQGKLAPSLQGAMTLIEEILLAHEGLQYRLRQSETGHADLTEEVALLAEVDRTFWDKLNPIQWKELMPLASHLDNAEPTRPDRLGPSLERLIRYSKEPDAFRTWEMLAEELKTYPQFAGQTLDKTRLTVLREKLRKLKTEKPKQEVIPSLALTPKTNNFYSWPWDFRKQFVELLIKKGEKTLTDRYIFTLSDAWGKGTAFKALDIRQVKGKDLQVGDLIITLGYEWPRDAFPVYRIFTGKNNDGKLTFSHLKADGTAAKQIEVDDDTKERYWKLASASELEEIEQTRRSKPNSNDPLMFLKSQNLHQAIVDCIAGKDMHRLIRIENYLESLMHLLGGPNDIYSLVKSDVKRSRQEGDVLANLSWNSGYVSYLQFGLFQKEKSDPTKNFYLSIQGYQKYENHFQSDWDDAKAIMATHDEIKNARTQKQLIQPPEIPFSTPSAFIFLRTNLANILGIDEMNIGPGPRSVSWVGEQGKYKEFKIAALIPSKDEKKPIALVYDLETAEKDPGTILEAVIQNYQKKFFDINDQPTLKTLTQLADFKEQWKQKFPSPNVTRKSNPITSLLGLAKDADSHLLPLPKEPPIATEKLEAIRKLAAQIGPPGLVASLPAISQAYYASHLPSYAILDNDKGKPVLLYDEHLRNFVDPTHQAAMDLLEAILLIHEGRQHRLRQHPSAGTADLTEELALFAEVDQPVYKNLKLDQRTALEQLAKALDAAESNRPNRMEPSLDRLMRYSQAADVVDEPTRWQDVAAELTEYPQFKGQAVDWDRFQNLREEIKNPDTLKENVLSSVFANIPIGKSLMEALPQLVAKLITARTIALANPLPPLISQFTKADQVVDYLSKQLHWTVQWDSDKITDQTMLIGPNDNERNTLYIRGEYLRDPEKLLRDILQTFRNEPLPDSIKIQQTEELIRAQATLAIRTREQLIKHLRAILEWEVTEQPSGIHMNRPEKPTSVNIPLNEMNIDLILEKLKTQFDRPIFPWWIAQEIEILQGAIKASRDREPPTIEEAKQFINGIMAEAHLEFREEPKLARTGRAHWFWWEGPEKPLGVAYDSGIPNGIVLLTALNDAPEQTSKWEAAKPAIQKQIEEWRARMSRAPAPVTQTIESAAILPALEAALGTAFTELGPTDQNVLAESIAEIVKAVKETISRENSELATLKARRQLIQQALIGTIFDNREIGDGFYLIIAIGSKITYITRAHRLTGSESEIKEIDLSDFSKLGEAKPPNLSRPDDKFEVGEKVEMKADDGSWHHATITQAVNSQTDSASKGYNVTSYDKIFHTPFFGGHGQTVYGPTFDGVRKLSSNPQLVDYKLNITTVQELESLNKCIAELEPPQPKSEATPPAATHGTPKSVSNVPQIIEADSITELINKLPRPWKKRYSFKGIGKSLGTFCILEHKLNPGWKIEMNDNNYLVWGLHGAHGQGLFYGTGLGFMADSYEDPIVKAIWDITNNRLTLVMLDSVFQQLSHEKLLESSFQTPISSRIISKSEWEREKFEFQRQQVIRDVLRTHQVADDALAVGAGEHVNASEARVGDLVVIMDNARLFAAGLLRPQYEYDSASPHQYDIGWPGKSPQQTVNLDNPELETYRLASADELKKLGYDIESTPESLANPPPSSDLPIDRLTDLPAAAIENAIKDLLQTPISKLSEPLVQTAHRLSHLFKQDPLNPNNSMMQEPSASNPPADGDSARLKRAPQDISMPTVANLFRNLPSSWEHVPSDSKLAGNWMNQKGWVGKMSEGFAIANNDEPNDWMIGVVDFKKNASMGVTWKNNRIRKGGRLGYHTAGSKNDFDKVISLPKDPIVQVILGYDPFTGKSRFTMVFEDAVAKELGAPIQVDSINDSVFRVIGATQWQSEQGAPKTPVTSLLGLAKDADPHLLPIPHTVVPDDVVKAINKEVSRIVPKELRSSVPELTEAYYSSHMPSYAVLGENQGKAVLELDEHLRQSSDNKLKPTLLTLMAKLWIHEAIQHQLRQVEKSPADLTEELALFAEVDLRVWQNTDDAQKSAWKKLAKPLDAAEPNRPDRLGPSFERLERYGAMPDERKTWEALATELQEYPQFAGHIVDWNRFQTLRRQIHKETTLGNRLSDASPAGQKFLPWLEQFIEKNLNKPSIKPDLVKVKRATEPTVSIGYFDYSRAQINKAAFSNSIQKGDPIPGLPGKKWKNAEVPIISADGTRLFINIEIDGIEQILELDRNPESGKLSNARVRIKNGEAIPGLKGMTWFLAGTPSLSADGTRLFIPVELDDVQQILELERDPTDGTLSNAKVCIKMDDPIPGLKGVKWDWNLLHAPVLSADGTRLFAYNVFKKNVSQFIELDRNPQSGKLSNARVRISTDDPVPGLPNNNKWEFASVPAMSADGKHFWIVNRMEDNNGKIHKMLELNRDPATGELSDAQIRFSSFGDQIPGLSKSNHWYDISNRSILSTDGTRMWIISRNDGSRMIYEMQTPAVLSGTELENRRRKITTELQELTNSKQESVALHHNLLTNELNEVNAKIAEIEANAGLPAGQAGSPRHPSSSSEEDDLARRNASSPSRTEPEEATGASTQNRTEKSLKEQVVLAAGQDSPDFETLQKILKQLSNKKIPDIYRELGISERKPNNPAKDSLLIMHSGGQIEFAFYESKLPGYPNTWYVRKFNLTNKVIQGPMAIDPYSIGAARTDVNLVADPSEIQAVISRAELEKEAQTIPAFTAVLKERFVEAVGENGFHSSKGHQAMVAVEQELARRFPANVNKNTVWDELGLPPSTKADVKKGDMVIYRRNDGVFLLYEVEDRDKDDRISVTRNSTVESLSNRGEGEDGGSARLFVRKAEIVARQAQDPYELRKRLIEQGVDGANEAGYPAFNAARNILAAVNDVGDPVVRFWDVTDRAHIKPIATWSSEPLQISEKLKRNRVFDMGFSKDGSVLALGRGEQTIELRDITDLKNPKFIKAIEFHSVGHPITYQFWDAQDFKRPINLTSEERSAVIAQLGIWKDVIDKIPPVVDQGIPAFAAKVVKDAIQSALVAAGAIPAVAKPLAEAIILAASEPRLLSGGPMAEAIGHLLNTEHLALSTEEKSTSHELAVPPQPVKEQLIFSAESISKFIAECNKRKIGTRDLSNKEKDNGWTAVDYIGELVFRRSKSGWRIMWKEHSTDHGITERGISWDREGGTFDILDYAWRNIKLPLTHIEWRESEKDSDRGELTLYLTDEVAKQIKKSTAKQLKEHGILIQPNSEWKSKPELPAATQKNHADLKTELAIVEAALAKWQWTFTTFLIEQNLEKRRATFTGPKGQVAEQLIQIKIEEDEKTLWTTETTPVQNKQLLAEYRALLRKRHDLNDAIEALTSPAAPQKTKTELDAELSEVETDLSLWDRAFGALPADYQDLFEKRDELRHAIKSMLEPAAPLASSRADSEPLPSKLIDRLDLAFEKEKDAIAVAPSLSRWKWNGKDTLELIGRNESELPSNTFIASTGIKIRLVDPGVNAGYEIAAHDLNAKGDLIEYYFTYEPSENPRKIFVHAIVNGIEQSGVELPWQSFLLYHIEPNGLNIVLRPQDVEKLKKSGFPLKISTSDGFVLSFTSEQYAQSAAAPTLPAASWQDELKELLQEAQMKTVEPLRYSIEFTDKELKKPMMFIWKHNHGGGNLKTIRISNRLGLEEALKIIIKDKETNENMLRQFFPKMIKLAEKKLAQIEKERPIVLHEADSPTDRLNDSPAVLKVGLSALQAALNMPFDLVPNGEKVLAKLIEAAEAWATFRDERQGTRDEKAISEIDTTGPADILNKGVEVLEISVRAYNAIRNVGVITIGDLIQFSRAELVETFKKSRQPIKTIPEIEETLAMLGLNLKGSTNKARQVLAGEIEAAKNAGQVRQSIDRFEVMSFLDETFGLPAGASGTNSPERLRTPIVEIRTDINGRVETFVIDDTLDIWNNLVKLQILRAFKENYEKQLADLRKDGITIADTQIAPQLGELNVKITEIETAKNAAQAAQAPVPPPTMADFEETLVRIFKVSINYSRPDSDLWKEGRKPVHFHEYQSMGNTHLGSIYVLDVINDPLLALKGAIDNVPTYYNQERNAMEDQLRKWLANVRSELIQAITNEEYGMVQQQEDVLNQFLENWTWETFVWKVLGATSIKDKEARLKDILAVITADRKLFIGEVTSLQGNQVMCQGNDDLTVIRNLQDAILKGRVYRIADAAEIKAPSQTTSSFATFLKDTLGLEWLYDIRPTVMAIPDNALVELTWKNGRVIHILVRDDLDIEKDAVRILEAIVKAWQEHFKNKKMMKETERVLQQLKKKLAELKKSLRNTLATPRRLQAAA